ncbi:hypothetical protein E2C01_077248 [Portunus trituberculatus]|uniref:Uncharacterized protein n=1 Tax=Portunus trituberculatus TaxID=210409 RepID=A0A5B7IQV6_PORTR|nr:hypothetical protein [Portunus trituberculatus]
MVAVVVATVRACDKRREDGESSKKGGREVGRAATRTIHHTTQVTHKPTLCVLTRPHQRISRSVWLLLAAGVSLNTHRVEKQLPCLSQRHARLTDG